MTTPQRLLVPVLACLSLGLGIFAYSEHQARLTAETRLYTAQAENARLTTAAQQAAAPAMLPVPAAEPVATVTEAPPPVEPGPTGNEPGRRGPPGGREEREGFRAMMDSPEMQQLMNLRARSGLDARYAALFKALNLNPDQLERFQQLLVDKQNTTRDVIAAMRSQGLTPNRESADQMRALVQSANAEIDAQIRSELGEATYAQYQNYEATQPQRAVVERVQQRLSYSPSPLTEQQAASLVAILAQASAGATPVTGPRGVTVGGGVVINDAVLAQAQAVLNPAQYAIVLAMQKEQQAQAELLRRARQNRPATGSAR